jgi:hypothetical protein
VHCTKNGSNGESASYFTLKKNYTPAFLLDDRTAQAGRGCLAAETLCRTHSADRLLKIIADNSDGKQAFLEKTFPGFLSILRYSLTKKDDAELMEKVKVLLQHYIDFSVTISLPFVIRMIWRFFFFS